MLKVSVIIPIYNVERYFERCLHSLFGQTLEDIEYIFVDDCSTDASASKIVEVLEFYPHRRRQVQVLSHEANLGVAAARTSGIKAATGDYIIHCDSDDYVELDMYETLYNRAVDTNADIIACYYWEEQQGRKNIICRKFSHTPQKCLKNIYKKNCHCSRLWDKLIRRSLIVEHNIFPYKGCDYAEDLGCIVKILYYASSISVVERPMYHYCKRETSITSNVKSLYFWNMRKSLVDRVCDFLSCDAKYKIACHQMQFYIKMEYRTAFLDKEYEWFKVYKSSHKYILRYNDMPLKGRILWWMVLRNYTIFQIARKIIPVLR